MTPIAVAATAIVLIILSLSLQGSGHKSNKNPIISSDNKTSASVIVDHEDPSYTENRVGKKPPQAGIYIPLYTSPDIDEIRGEWNRVIEAKKNHPNVPFIVTINPASGPGRQQNMAYVEAIHELKSAGIENILGYIPTDYGVGSQNGARSMEDIKQMMDQYKSWYPEVNGLMLDEVSSSESKLEFYSELEKYARSIGYTYIRGNPGTRPAEGYLQIFDNVSIYEGREAPSISDLAISTYHNNNNNSSSYPRTLFSFTARDIADLDLEYLNEVTNSVFYL